MCGCVWVSLSRPRAFVAAKYLKTVELGLRRRHSCRALRVRVPRRWPVLEEKFVVDDLHRSATTLLSPYRRPPCIPFIMETCVWCFVGGEGGCLELSINPTGCRGICGTQISGWSRTSRRKETDYCRLSTVLLQLGTIVDVRINVSLSFG